MESDLIKCPKCGEAGTKVLYSGIPAKFCLNESCSTLWGVGSYLIAMLPFNGMFVHYDGSYFSALWFFLSENDEDGA